MHDDAQISNQKNIAISSSSFHKIFYFLFKEKHTSMNIILLAILFFISLTYSLSIAANK